MTSIDLYSKGQVDSLLNTKQNQLVSGTNIRTVNGNSLLGAGDISISAGNLTKCYTGLESNPNYDITVDTIYTSIRNTLGTADGVYLVCLISPSTSIISGESMYGVWGLLDTGSIAIVEVLGIADDYTALKDTYVILGGRVGHSGGTVTGSINKIVAYNTSNNTTSVVQMPATFEVYACRIANGRIV